MRARTCKAIRKIMRTTGMGEAGQLMGDSRTVRYFYRQRDGIIKKSANEAGPAGSHPIMATYTLTRAPNDPRRVYQRIKRQARHVAR